MDNAISRPPEDVDLNLARPASRIGKLVGKALGRPYAIDKSADSIESATKHYAIPDETADEIFVVHTFDDPDVKEQGSLIPREAYRMLTPGGTINVYDRTRNLIRINDLLTDAGFEIQYFNFDESTINNDREFYSQTAALGCYQQDAEHTFNTADKYPDILFIATKPATR